MVRFLINLIRFGHLFSSCMSSCFTCVQGFRYGRRKTTIWDQVKTVSLPVDAGRSEKKVRQASRVWSRKRPELRKRSTHDMLHIGLICRLPTDFQICGMHHMTEMTRLLTWRETKPHPASCHRIHPSNYQSWLPQPKSIHLPNFPRFLVF